MMKLSFRRLALVALSATLLAACAATDDEATATSTDALDQAHRWKVLNVDYQVQSTSYWCGPASTRIAISARKAAPSQGQLANELPTTRNGTDTIDQVTRVLNAHLGPGKYATKLMPNDPPTPAQKMALWNDIVVSIDQGYAVVANIVAPPHNHPPGYPNRTIYHYVALIGYNPDTWEIYVADPANFGGYRQYWLKFDQVATLIPPKGYSSLPGGTTCPNGSGSTVGAIDIKYRAMGGCNSVLGIPLTGERGSPDGVGRYNVFERGSIYWTPELGAHAVIGRIRDAWKDEGWEIGRLGYPTSDEYAVPGGRRSDFENGWITWDAASNTTSVTMRDP